MVLFDDRPGRNTKMHDTKSKVSNFVVTVGRYKKYKGNFITFSSLEGGRILTYGKDIGKVIAEARKKGVDEPVVRFVHKKGESYMY